jgi:hypothetical protein
LNLGGAIFIDPVQTTPSFLNYEYRVSFLGVKEPGRGRKIGLGKGKI